MLADLAPIRHEVRSRGGRWYDMRMRPYRTIDDKIDGVVVTFVDVFERPAAEAGARARMKGRLPPAKIDGTHRDDDLDVARRRREIFARPPARLPELHRGHRHVEVRAGAARNSVGDGIHHGRDRGRGAGFADAFDAERIGRRRHRMHGVADAAACRRRAAWRSP